MEQTLLILANVPDEEIAHRIAHLLVERRLAACVNVLPWVRSVYRWQDKLEEASEVPLLIKTTAVCYAELEAELKAAHPYEVPEILAVSVVNGLPAYLGWVAAETKKELDG